MSERWIGARASFLAGCRFTHPILGWLSTQRRSSRSFALSAFTLANRQSRFVAAGGRVGRDEVQLNNSIVTEGQRKESSRQSSGRGLAGRWVALGFLLLSVGCGEGGMPRGQVGGEVTQGGKPLMRGRILFTPLPPTVGPASSAIIRDGQYQFSTADGPIVGQHRVQIEAEADLGFELDDEEAYAKSRGKRVVVAPIPPAFGAQSQLTTVVEPGKKRFDVAIP